MFFQINSVPDISGSLQLPSFITSRSRGTDSHTFLYTGFHTDSIIDILFKYRTDGLVFFQWKYHPVQFLCQYSKVQDCPTIPWASLKGTP